ncbi:MAG TPA: hypothetical protein VFA20_09185 [Myxococcaceae bacterium]|nr:hypothetical protein [Myxococcaceae bacterium]
MLSLLLALAAAPAPTPAQAAAEVVTRFFAASSAGDARTAWECLSSEDQAAKPFAEFAREMERVRDLARHSGAARTVRKVEVDGSRAVVTLEVEGPDPREVTRELFAHAKEPGALDTEAAIRRLDRKIASGEIARVRRTQELTAVKEPGGWRVRLGYALLRRAMRGDQGDEAARRRRDQEALERAAADQEPELKQPLELRRRVEQSLEKPPPTAASTPP